MGARCRRSEQAGRSTEPQMCTQLRPELPLQNAIKATCITSLDLIKSAQLEGSLTISHHFLTAFAVFSGWSRPQLPEGERRVPGNLWHCHIRNQRTDFLQCVRKTCFSGGDNLLPELSLRPVVPTLRSPSCFHQRSLAPVLVFLARMCLHWCRC